MFGDPPPDRRPSLSDRLLQKRAKAQNRTDTSSHKKRTQM
jgi:hypothetical protein